MRLLWVALGAGILLAAGRKSDRLEGEYGLWVEDRNDSLVVHWLTRAAGAGVLRADNQQHFTPSGEAHRVALRRPKGRTVTLVYGSRQDATDRDTTIITLQGGSRAPVARAADSVYVFGDTHGEFDHVIQLLHKVGLINDALHWTGGRKQLVFNGDLVDRGADVTRLLWFVYGLEREAAAAGGRVHVVLGNHETMIWLGDLRYVQPKELALAQKHGAPYWKLFDLRQSVLGRWLSTKPAVLKLDQLLFAHGGVSADYLTFNARMFDDTLSTFLKEELIASWNDTTVAVRIDSASYERRLEFISGPRSVFWYREYVQSNAMGDALDRVLKRFGASVHVVAHTPTSMVHQKYGGKLIAAHPRTPATEMVLLVRSGRDYIRYRIDQAGNTQPLPLVE